MNYTGSKRRKAVKSNKTAKKKSQGQKVREAKNPTKIRKMRADKLIGRGKTRLA